MKVRIGWNPYKRGFWYANGRWCLNTGRVWINAGYFIWDE